MVQQRILASVSRDDVVGRDAELQQIARQASRLVERRGLVLLAAPGVGSGELMHQAYDEIFSRRGNSIPIHFAFRRSDATPTDAARRFFQSFLQQYIAYRRVDPSVCKAPLTLHDLLELALPSDYELVNTILENFERERAASDQRDFVRFCFNAPQRLTAAGRNVFHLIDCVQIAGQSEIMLGQ